MFSTDEYRSPSRTELRRFGLILATGFAIIGALPALHRHDPRVWALVVSSIFGLAALIAPIRLRRVHRVWMAIGATLGWIKSRFILGVVYYLMVTPARGILKLAGPDPMRRTFDRQIETYRVNRTPRPASHFERQF